MAAKNNDERRFRSKGAKVAFVIAFIVFAVYAFIMISMILWAFLQSLKTEREFVNDMISLPKDWLFSNYAEAFRSLQFNQVGFVGLFLNSVWYSAGLSFLGVFSSCVTGYIFAKYAFFGKKVAFSFILFTLTIPIIGNLPSMYKVIYTLKLNDSILYLLTGLGGFGGSFLVTYAFFKNIDTAYNEAAKIDGASHLTIFLRIMLPLAAGPFSALFIMAVITNWNAVEEPILYLNRMPTLSSGLYYYRSITLYEHNQPVFLAGVLISMVPVLILVSAFGNKLMQNMTMGGLKG